MYQKVVISALLFLSACLCVYCGNVSASNLRGIKSTPTMDNSSYIYYQTYEFQGPDCKMDSLTQLQLYPIYKPADVCVQVAPGAYQKATCTDSFFILEEACDSECHHCLRKQEIPISPRCSNWNIFSSYSVCGKIQANDIPKMLWNVKHEHANGDCSKNKVVQATGSGLLCEWNLRHTPFLRTCNSTDYSIEKYAGSVKECDLRDRFSVTRGKINVCNGNEEYKCQ